MRDSSLLVVRKSFAVLLTLGAIILLPTSIILPGEVIWALLFVCAISSAAMILIAVGLWRWPRLSWPIPAGIVLAVLSMPLGNFIAIPLQDGRPRALSRILNPEYFAVLCVATVIGFLLFRYAIKRSTILGSTESGKSSQELNLAAADPSSLLVISAKLQQECRDISRGSYIASALWIAALLFVAIDSGAFTGHFLSFFAFALLPIVILFATDWMLGRWGRA